MSCSLSSAAGSSAPGAGISDRHKISSASSLDVMLENDPDSSQEGNIRLEFANYLSLHFQLGQENMLRTLTPYLILFALLVPLPASADWWSDNGDSAGAEDIDSGAQSETTANDDLVKDAQGPGQPQNNPQNQTPMMYDAWGRPYAYGMPYGYGPGFGYGMGYMAGPYARGGVRPGR